jgi:hypothetical protein
MLRGYQWMGMKDGMEIIERGNRETGDLAICIIISHFLYFLPGRKMRLNEGTSLNTTSTSHELPKTKKKIKNNKAMGTTLGE